jgi:hypothetical protein
MGDDDIIYEIKNDLNRIVDLLESIDAKSTPPVSENALLIKQLTERAEKAENALEKHERFMRWFIDIINTPARIVAGCLILPEGNLHFVIEEIFGKDFYDKEISR